MRFSISKIIIFCWASFATVVYANDEEEWRKKSVGITSGKVMDVEGRRLSGKTDVQWLNVLRVGVDSDDIRWISEQKDLKCLTLGAHLESVRINSGLDSLRKLKSLKILRLSFPGMNESRLSFLEDLSGVESLTLTSPVPRDFKFTQTMADWIGGMRGLYFLRVVAGGITDEMLSVIIANCPLESLYLNFDQAEITNDALEQVFEMGELRDLSISGAVFDPDAMGAISEDSKIEHLSIGFSHAPISVFRVLSKIKTLGSLRIENAVVSYEAMKTLEVHPSLERVYFGASSATRDQIDSMNKNSKIVFKVSKIIEK